MAGGLVLLAVLATAGMGLAPGAALAAAPTAPVADQAVLNGKLERAAFLGDLPAVETLLDVGADLDARDEHGYTPLIWAAQYGHDPVVAALLAHGAKVDATDLNGYTALIWAAQQGQAKVVARLLVSGADLAPREKHGYAALDWAARMGHLQVVKLLLARGADPQLHAPGGPSALELARRSGQPALVALLESAGGQPEPAPTPTPAPHLVPSWRMLGHSTTGLPIPAVSIGNGPRTVLLIGTIHGNEPQGENVILRLIQEVEAHPALIDGARLVAVPVANPDGKARHTRGNARGVDLNRNFPTAWQATGKGLTYGGPFPLSEPESRLLLSLIKQERPALIVSFHAAMMANNFDGAAAGPIARQMAKLNGYRFLPDIGYPTPGSLGHYASQGLGIPIITLEVGHEADDPLYAKVRDSLMLVLRPRTRG